LEEQSVRDITREVVEHVNTADKLFTEEQNCILSSMSKNTGKDFKDEGLEKVSEVVLSLLTRDSLTLEECWKQEWKFENEEEFFELVKEKEGENNEPIFSAIK
jgi:hypothetical protein